MSSDRFRVTEHVVPGQHVREYPAATNGNQNEVLEVCVKQYVPLEWAMAEAPEGAVTIISTHANAMPKELYEPLWDDLLDASRGKFHIRGIWLADAMNQGNSYLRNEGKLGNDPSWFDSSRDLLQIINHFRQQMPRPLVGIGHSFGAAHLTHLSLFHPRLFSSLILLDPVIVAGSPRTKVPGVANPWGIIYLSAYRRDLWSSRTAARESLSRNPFYMAWDPRVFDKLIEYGLVEVPTAIYPNLEMARAAAVKAAKRESGSSQGNESDTSATDAVLSPETNVPVTLKTTKHQELMTFARPNFYALDDNGNRLLQPRTHPDTTPSGPLDYPFYRPESTSVYNRLPHLRPPTFWILGARTTISTPSELRENVVRTGIGVGGNGGEARNQDGSVPGIAGLGTKEVTLPKVGHLVPMEAPKKTAELCCEWVGEVLERWEYDEREYKEDMTLREMPENLMIGKNWEKAIASGKPGETPGVWKLKL